MNKMMKKAMAAAFALTIAGGIPSVLGNAGIFTLSPVIEVKADSAGSAVLDEETGVLTLSGMVTAEQIWAHKGKIEKIVCEEGTVLPADSSGLFYFGNIGHVSEIDLSNADTSEVTDMSRMFRSQGEMTSLNISSFNTSNVTNMESMFESCDSLTSLDVTGFDTSKVTNMSFMFAGCKNLISLNLHSFDTGNVTNMRYMFNVCYGLTSLDLSTFNTKNVTNMHSMFKLMKSLEKIYVSDGWSTAAVKVSGEMFWFSSKLVGDKGSQCGGGEKLDARFAHPDGGKTNPGYLSYVTPAAPAATAAKSVIKGTSITLGGKIGVNFYAEVPSTVKKAVLDGPNGKVVLNIDGIEGSRQYTDDENIDTYKLTYDIDSNQANEKVSVSFYDEDETKPIDLYNSAGVKDADGFIEYSVNDYIAKNYKISENTKLNSLVSALDNYCKASENYFDNKNHTIKGIENISGLSDMSFETTHSDETIDGKISLVLNSGTSMRIYFNNPVESCEYDNGDNLSNAAHAIKGIGKNGEYYEVPSFNAYDLLYDYNIYYKEKGSENYVTKTFSPIRLYTKRVFEDPASDKKLKDVLKALNVYGNAAIDYKNSVQ